MTYTENVSCRNTFDFHLYQKYTTTTQFKIKVIFPFSQSWNGRLKLRFPFSMSLHIINAAQRKRLTKLGCAGGKSSYCIFP